MTEPVTPWAEFHRNEWADLTDPMRAPETDEEPWDVLDAAIVGTASRTAALSIVGVALTLVLLVLGIRKAVGR